MPVAHPLQAVRISTAGAPSPSTVSAVGCGAGVAQALPLLDMDWPVLVRAAHPRLDPVGPSAAPLDAATVSTGRKIAQSPQQLCAGAAPKDSVADGATPVDAAPLQVTQQSSPLPLITLIGARF